MAASADFDCSSDFTLYWSPIINGFHLSGVEWGWWNISTPKPREIEARLGDLSTNFGLFPANQFSYAAELVDTDVRRFYATSWACYFDRDADGIIDTYLFDTDNNGLFDTRVWYDRRRASLLWAEGNRFQRAPLRLEFPAESFALANYRKLRDFYQKMLRDHEPLVTSQGQVRVRGSQDAEPQATVGLDLYHAGAAWHDTGRKGSISAPGRWSGLPTPKARQSSTPWIKMASASTVGRSLFSYSGCAETL